MASFEFLAIILTGLGMTISLLYYTFTLQNANKTRQAALFMNIYNQTTTKEAQEDYMIIETIEMNSVQDWNELKKNPEIFKVLAWHFTYYEGIGVLLHEGLIDVGLVARMYSGNIIWFWEKYRDGVMDLRKHTNWARWAVEVEYFYDQMVAYSKKHPDMNISTPDSR